jgi:hypothetical protein
MVVERAELSYNDPMNDPRENAPYRDVGRRTPAKDVHVSLAGSNWIYLTVCTSNHECWLANSRIQEALHHI